MHLWRSMKRCSVVVLFFAVTAPALWAQNQFQRGDGVRVAVWRDPSREGINIQGLGITGDYTIDSRGNIQMPLVGEMRVVGSTPEGLATSIKEKYAAYISDMIVICYPLIRISVLGAVQKPGSYFIERRTTLWELIEIAGGLDGQANIQKIHIQRSGKTVAKDLMSGYEKATSLEELRVQSGDQVLIPGQSRITMRTIIEVTRFALGLATFVIVQTK